jgi:hypothetical protein
MRGSVGRNALTTLPHGEAAAKIFDSVRRKFVRASVMWSNKSYILQMFVKL